jgi:hypothetical protein
MTRHGADFHKQMVACAVCGHGLPSGDAKCIMAILLATRDMCSVNKVCGSPTNLSQN